MATSIFMKVTPASGWIKGGSTERSHVDWFDVGSVQASVEANSSLTSGGWSIGRPNVNSFSVRLSEQAGFIDLWGLITKGLASAIVIEKWSVGSVVRKTFQYEFTGAFFRKIALVEDTSSAADVWSLEFAPSSYALNQYIFSAANGTTTPTTTRRIVHDVRAGTVTGP